MLANSLLVLTYTGKLTRQLLDKVLPVYTLLYKYKPPTPLIRNHGIYQSALKWSWWHNIPSCGVCWTSRAYVT